MMTRPAGSRRGEYGHVGECIYELDLRQQFDCKRTANNETGKKKLCTLTLVPRPPRERLMQQGQLHGVPQLWGPRGRPSPQMSIT